MTAAPEFVIRDGEMSARVSPIGATLVDLRHGRESLLSGPEHVDPSRGHHGAVLAPWPNRIEDGRYRFGGIGYELVERDAVGHALHGFAFGAVWTILRAEESSVSLATRVVGERGYPHDIALSVEYSITHDRIRCTTSWRNAGSSIAPFGVGFHPYLRPGPSALEDWILEVPSITAMDTDPRSKLPLAERPVTPTADFLRPRRIGSAEFSRAYRLASDHITVSDPHGWVLSVQMSPEFGWAQVFTADLPDVGLRRRGLAIEPQTCPPNAFNTGTDILTLAPGDAGTAWWQIAASRG